MVPEFELTVTSTAPLRGLSAAAALRICRTVPEVSAAPMRAPARPTVTLTFVGPADAGPVDRADRLTVDALKQGSFADRHLGPGAGPGRQDVPAGDVLSAVDRLVIRTRS